MNLKEIKLLYLSCHEVLEQQELQLFADMSLDVFSNGAYLNPAGHDTLKRPAIKGMKYDPELEKWSREFPKTSIPQEYLDKFNVIMVMHQPEWITENWAKMKDKKVIWRSIGQSNVEVENMIRRMRYEGLKIVRYSPMEDHIPGSLSSDALIRFYEDEDEFKDWNGNTKRVINISQTLKGRGPSCHYDQIMQIISGFPALIYGTGNDALGPLNGGELPYELLKGTLRDSRVFLYGGTYPAPYTLSFIEALMTGIPIVSIGPSMAEEIAGVDAQRKFKFFEIPEIIRNGENGYYSDNIDELRGYINTLLENHELAKKIGEEGRKTAIRIFSKTKARENWTKFFNTL